MAIPWQRGRLFAALVYCGLVLRAFRDLFCRPIDRLLNGAGWVRTVVCLPIVGAMLYGYRGTAPRASAGAISIEPDFIPFDHLFDDDEIGRKRIP